MNLRIREFAMHAGVWILLVATLSFQALGEEAKPEVPATPETKEVAPESPPKGPNVGYDKGFFIESPDQKFKMTIGGYIQGYVDYRGVEAGPNTDTFRVRRARIKWAGHAFTKNFQYELEYDFPANKLLEGVLQVVQSDAFKFRIGQFHVPYSFEQQTSSSNLQFVDRSIAFTFFGIPDEREPGTGFNGVLFNKKFEYDIGAFNGEGLNTLNKNQAFRYAGRFVYNVAGRHGYEFADTKHSEEPQIAIAAGGMFNDTPDSATVSIGTGLPTNDMKVTSIVADASAKYKGFSFHGEFLYRHTNPEVSASTDDTGFVGQVGYFVVPKMFELGARVARIYADASNDKGEYTFGANYYIHNGHSLKFQVDYGILTETNGISAGNDRVDHLIRGQLQLKI